VGAFRFAIALAPAPRLIHVIFNPLTDRIGLSPIPNPPRTEPQ
jgi:hypothetical protein